jgi:hypothetical protein
LISFINKYKPGEAIIVSEIEQETRTIETCEVRFIPFAKLI